MSTGQYDLNVIVPSTANTTIGTSAVQLKTSSTLAVKFTLSNNGAQPIYIGDSNVAANRCTVKIAAGSNFTFGPDKFYHNRAPSYDLARFFAIATAASQVLTLTTYTKGTSGLW